MIPSSTSGAVLHGILQRIGGAEWGCQGWPAWGSPYVQHHAVMGRRDAKMNSVAAHIQSKTHKAVGCVKPQHEFCSLLRIKPGQHKERHFTQTWIECALRLHFYKENSGLQKGSHDVSTGYHSVVTRQTANPRSQADSAASEKGGSANAGHLSQHDMRADTTASPWCKQHPEEFGWPSCLGRADSALYAGRRAALRLVKFEQEPCVISLRGPDTLET